MKHAWLGVLLASACTAQGRCDPSPSFSVRAREDGGGHAAAPAHCGEACSVTGVSAGAFHTCAALSTRVAVCFGRNDAHQLGPSAPLGVRSRPRILDNADLAAASVLHSCVLEAGPGRASIRCYGRNVSGTLGSDTDAMAGGSNVSGDTSARQLSLGSVHIAVRVADRVSLWGDNHFDQLGDTTRERYLTRDEPSDLRGVIDMDAGGVATCAVHSTGNVRCVGVFPLEPRTLSSEASDDVGPALRFGAEFAPVPGVEDAIAVSVGVTHACAVTQGGTIYCWGASESGQVRDAPEDGSARPIPLDRPAFAVSAGGAHELIVEAPLRYRLRPLPRAHTCALAGERQAAEVYCWGANDRGQLGDGTLAASAEPRQVALPFVSQVSAGGAHTCAVTRGELWCWGDNTYGQLGVSPKEIDRSDFPIRVDLRSPFLDLARDAGAPDAQ